MQEYNTPYPEIKLTSSQIKMKGNATVYLQTSKHSQFIHRHHHYKTRKTHRRIERKPCLTKRKESHATIQRMISGYAKKLLKHTYFTVLRKTELQVTGKQYIP